MSWLFSQALVAEFSAGTCSAGAPFAPLSGSPTPQAFLSPDRMTAFSRLSRFGMTFKPLTDDHGEAVLMSFLEAFPAKTLAQPEKAQALTESDQGCGRTWPESFARWDRASSSWKTPQCSLLADLDVFSETWPRWGMMRDGESWELPTPPRLTSENESGLWPTPNQRDWKDTGATQGNRKSPNLGTMAARYPTPRAEDSQCAGEHRGKDDTLYGIICKPKDGSVDAGGQLNPTWVEKLMGWPQNWTEVKPMIDFQFISWNMGFCECENTRTKEVMRVLRNSNGAQNFQRKAGRPLGIQEAEVLLSIMFQHQIGSDEAWLLMEGAEAPQGEVRGVRIQAGAASSPRRSGHQKQPTGEHPDSMQKLPRFLAYDGKAAWKDQSWENAVPRVATGVKNRVDRLRCIGNGQVPAVAQLAWRILTTSR